MSGNADGLKYDFELSPTSTYARAARLVRDGMSEGLSAGAGRVIDLGAGVGVLGQALVEHGIGYVGFEYEAASVAEMRRRGIDAHVLDLTADDAVDRILEQISIDPQRPIVAVTALDVVEHLPDPEHSAALLVALIDRLAAEQATAEQANAEQATVAPMLVLSIPNVAHFDLGAKLITGKWDITDAGLLDRTHVSLFDERRLTEVFGGHFDEVGRDDVEFAATEQRTDADHPVFAQAGVGAYLRHLRERSDDAGHRYQFVRSYRRRTEPPNIVDSAGTADAGAETAVESAAHPQPFCSVVVRTQGGRMSLVDTLATLAAQVDRDLEVLLMVHHDDDRVPAGIRSLVARFDPDFAAAVRVVHVTGGGRSAPLNAALDLARGRYLAIVDDDDVVTCQWIAEFRALADRHPGALLRGGCVEQSVERRDAALLDFEVVSGFRSPYPEAIDMVDMIRANRTPQCAYAVPLSAVRALGVRYDDDLSVCEDWKFQLDVARYTGWAGTAEITSVYRKWQGGGGSGTIPDAVWIADHERVVDDLDTVPTVLGPGILRRIHDLYTHIEHLETELGRRPPDAGPRRFTE